MVRTTRRYLAVLTAVVLLAPLPLLYAVDASAPKVGPVAPGGRTDSAPNAPAGSSVLNPVDDVVFARRGKAAWHAAFSRGEVFKRTDLEGAMNRREPLKLAPAPVAKAVLSDEQFPGHAHAATLALFTISEAKYKAGEGAALETAFLVQEGVAVTCFHAFKNLGETFAVVGLTASGQPVKVTKILAVYPLEDLAFVQVEGAGKAFLPLRASAPAGLRVRAVGHPLNHYFFTIEGTIGRYASKKVAGSDKLVRMNLIIGGIDGFSGGALVDAAGNAVGMLDSYAMLPAGDAKYQMQSAIPAVTILAHFTQPYDGTMSAEAVAALLTAEKPAGGNTVVIHTVQTRNSKGMAVAEVRSDDPRQFEISIEDATGNEIARGKPSAELRKRLPPWARDLYDDNLKEAEAKVQSILRTGAPPPAVDMSPTTNPERK